MVYAPGEGVFDKRGEFMRVKCKLTVAELAVIVAKYMGISPCDVSFHSIKERSGCGSGEYYDDGIECDVELSIYPDEIHERTEKDE